MGQIDGGSQEFISTYLVGLRATLDRLPHDDVHAFTRSLHNAYDRGTQVFVIGNGGSAATASHMACDLCKTVLGKAPGGKKRFRVIALTDNVPLLTAWGNDVGYETVFAEQLRNFAQAGDLLVVITGSGNSPNIVEAVHAARALGLRTVGLLGFNGGDVRRLLDQTIIIESDNYGYIEDAHMILTHLVTAYFKEALNREETTGQSVR